MGSGRATVSRHGTVRARKVGTTKVQLITHNGYRKTITVKVRDYATPSSLTARYLRDEVRTFLTVQKDDFTAVVEHFLQHPVTGNFASLYLDGEGRLVNPKNIPLGGIE